MKFKPLGKKVSKPDNIFILKIHLLTNLQIEFTYLNIAHNFLQLIIIIKYQKILNTASY